MINYENLTDRELDAEVAEKIFGHDIKWTDRLMPKRYEPFIRHGGTLRASFYSTDMNMAMEVAKKIKQTGDLHIFTPYKQELWKVRCTEIHNPREGVTVRDKALPRAICLAALKWAEEGIKMINKEGNR